MEIADSIFRPMIDYLRFGIELVGTLWIGVGAALAFFQLVMAHLRNQTASFTPIRLTFSRYLSLALEFQLASDILSTALAPSWAELGKLGVVAALRTALNYFLSREIHEYAEKREHDEAVVARRTEAAVNVATTN